MKDGKRGIKGLTVSSPEHVASRLSSKGEKSISVTRSDREEGKQIENKNPIILISFLSKGISTSHVISFHDYGGSYAEGRRRGREGRGLR